MELTRECLTSVISMASSKELCSDLLEMIISVSEGGRAAKQQPGLVALATAILYAPNAEAKKSAFSALTKICRTPTSLFTFVQCFMSLSKEVNESRGWGRGLRTAVQKWYGGKSGMDLAYAVTKYKQRGGMSHLDMLRMSHFPLSSAADEGAKVAIQYVQSPRRALQKTHPEGAKPVVKYLQCVDGVHLVADV